ncbi:MAG: hypothetical protein M1150_03730 [Patescibacteria group bacterium]|nr:hypothetical protein [Patescibacteria group bacterium]
MDSFSLSSIVSTANYQLLVKPIVSLFLIFYICFALIMVRQVGLMNSVLGTNLCPILKLIAYLHLIGSVAVLLVALSVL